MPWNAALRQFFHNAHQVTQVAPETSKFPDDQGIALAQRLEAGRQARAVILLARGAVLVDCLPGHAGFRQGVILEISVLCVPGLGDAGVSDVHVSYVHLLCVRGLYSVEGDNRSSGIRRTSRVILNKGSPSQIICAQTGDVLKHDSGYSQVTTPKGARVSALPDRG